MKKLIAALTGTALLLTCLSAAAIQIEVAPLSQNVTPGDPVSVDVNISGLGLFPEPSISTFDIDVSFDTALLDATAVVFGTELDLFGLGSVQSVSGSGPGSVNVFELSFDAPSDLNALQLDAFTLFTMNFDTLGDGTSAITLGLNSLGDADGLPLEASLVDGQISIVSDGTIPVPATMLLLSVGLLSLGLQRR